jgi:hypothetical protein
MTELSSEEKKKIYEEEKTRLEAQENLKKEAAAKKNKDAGIGCLVIVGIIGILWISGVFNSKKVSAPGTLPLQSSIMQIFGTPKNSDDSGVTKVIPGQTDCVIHYKYFPLGLFGYEKELGINLAPKIKEFYRKDNRAQNVKYMILGPFDDAYGKRKWDPVVSFEFTRGIFNRINWSNFSETNLLTVASNVTWLRKVT